LTQTTGVSVTSSGLTVSHVTVVTKSLNAPDTGVTPPAGATVTVCVADPAVTGGDVLEYWSGSTWVAAGGVTITGTKICGTVPLSAVSGTNFVVAPPAVSLLSNVYIWVLVAVVVIIVIGGAVWVLRRKKKPESSPAFNP
jgi:hypothetical protein